MLELIKFWFPQIMWLAIILLIVWGLVKIASHPKLDLRYPLQTHFVKSRSGVMYAIVLLIFLFVLIYHVEVRIENVKKVTPQAQVDQEALDTLAKTHEDQLKVIQNNYKLQMANVKRGADIASLEKSFEDTIQRLQLKHDLETKLLNQGENIDSIKKMTADLEAMYKKVNDELRKKNLELTEQLARTFKETSGPISSSSGASSDLVTENAILQQKLKTQREISGRLAQEKLAKRQPKDNSLLQLSPPPARPEGLDLPEDSEAQSQAEILPERSALPEIPPAYSQNKTDQERYAEIKELVAQFGPPRQARSKEEFKGLGWDKFSGCFSRPEDKNNPSKWIIPLSNVQTEAGQRMWKRYEEVSSIYETNDLAQR